MPEGIPIDLTGPSHTKRSRAISGQETVNFYTEKADETGENSDYTLQSWPGYASFATTGGTATRGVIEHNGVLYAIIDTDLVSIDKYGAATNLATVPGVAKCWIEPFGEDFVVVTGGVPYLYDVSAGSISTISDVDLETPNGAAFLNNQMIYDGDGSRFCVSDVGDATAIDGLNYAAAESNSDDLVIPYAFDQKVYMMGDKTIEPWWNSGVGSPPFDRVEGGIIPVGLKAQFSVAKNDRYTYFFADDRKVYRIGVGGGYEAVSSIAFVRESKAYKDPADAIGFCLTVEGQNFYYVAFPRENVSWLFSETAADWYKLTNGVATPTDPNGDIHPARYYAFAYDKHIFATEDDGNLYEWSTGYYDHAGTNVRRVRQTGDLTSAKLGGPAGRDVTMGRFQLFVEPGMGRISGQGSDPRIMLQFSDDYGKSWSEELWEDVGSMGDHDWVITWDGLGSFQQRRFRIAVSDPIQWTILGASTDVEFGI